jgi:hypothetical protein
MVNGMYIYCWTSGNYSLEHDPGGCKYSITEDGAIEIINQYKEFLGINDVIIKV